MNSKFQAYWAGKKSSGHRFNTDNFYRMKAREIDFLIDPEYKKLDCIDLGCGAGELLLHLSEYINIKVGLDFSESMLIEAKKRLLYKADISLVEANLFEYLPDQNFEVWLTCGAINQYLESTEQRRLLELFVSDPTSKVFYLFDCVDPIRYQILSLGVGYTFDPESNGQQTKRSWWRHSFLYSWIRQVWSGLKLAIMPPNQSFYRIGYRGKMGYGFLPKFWLSECYRLNLEAEILSSQFYEYRYHVIIRKPR